MLLQITFCRPTGVHFLLLSCKTFTFFPALHVLHKLCLPNPKYFLSHPTFGPHPPNPRPCFGAPLQKNSLARSQSFDNQPYPNIQTKQKVPQLSVLYTIVELVAKLCCIANKLLVVVPHHTSHRCSSVAKLALSLCSITRTLDHSLSNWPSANLIASFVQPHRYLHHRSCKLLLASLISGARFARKNIFNQRAKTFPLYPEIVNQLRNKLLALRVCSEIILISDIHC